MFKTISRVNILRISGIRFDGIPPAHMQAEIKNRKASIVKYLRQIPELYHEPFFLDDEQRAKTPEQLADYVMNTASEVFVVRSEDKKRLLGFHILEMVKPWHHAIWHAFLPAERGLMQHRWQSALEILEYAFRDCPQGLGLMKLKCHITAENLAAVKLVWRLGGLASGRLKHETLHQGVPHDMVIFEIHNPRLTPEESLDEIEPERPKHDEPGASDDAESTTVSIQSDGGAELRRLEHEPGDSGSQGASSDGGADDPIGASVGQSLAGAIEGDWHSIQPGGADQVGELLQSQLPEPQPSPTADRLVPRWTQ